MDSLIPKHGGYRGLKSFQISRLVFDITIRFCDKFIGARSRTHDQMVRILFKAKIISYFLKYFQKKVAMSRFFSLLILTFLSMISFALADESDHNRYLDFVEYQENSAKIYLTDGSTWNFTCDPATEEHLMLNLEEDFLPGSQIDIKIDEYKPTFLLYFKNKNGVGVTYCVGLTKETKKNLPTIVSLEPYVISEGWFWNDYECRVALSDGSIWAMTWSNKYAWNWRVGNHIIINSNSYNYKRIINTDANHNYNYFYTDSNNNRVQARFDYRSVSAKYVN